MDLLYFPTQVYAQISMGLGMATPDFVYKKVIYFYTILNPEKETLEYIPFDSLVFTINTYYASEIAYTPAWFYPEHIKMDYDLLMLKLVSITNNWIEVVVNQETEQTVWMSSADVKVMLWPEFLLHVYAIENPSLEKNPLRIKPLQHAAMVKTINFAIMKPFLVKEEWVKVKLYDNDFNEVGEAWLQWRNGKSLLITYSLLC